MNVREIWRAVKRWWWLVLAGTGLSLGTAGFATALMTPEYATSLTFLVTTPSRGASDSYQGNLVSQQRVSSYASLLTSDQLTRGIADSGVGLSALEVKDRISAQAVPERALLEAVVTDTDQARSRRMAAELAKDSPSTSKRWRLHQEKARRPSGSSS